MPRDCRARWSMTGDTSRRLVFAAAAAIEPLAVIKCRGIRNNLGGRRLFREIDSQIAHILIRQHHCLPEHERLGPRPGLERLQLFDDIGWMLAGDARPYRVDAVAIRTMAGTTGQGLGLAGFGGTLHEALCRSHSG